MSGKRHKQPPAKKLIAQERRSSASLLQWVIPVLLIVIAVASLCPVCGAQFLVWDDNFTISANPHFNPPTWSAMAFYWQHEFMELYVPVTYMVWGILAKIAWDPEMIRGQQLNPLVFHTANLILHVLNVLLIWALLWRWLHIARKKDVKQPAALSISCAAGIGALVFAVHPVQVEVVAWASGLKDVLYTFLSLSALWLYTTYASHASAGERSRYRWWCYGAAVLCLILSMLSKPSAMVTPAIAVIADLLMIRRRWTLVMRDLTPWLLLMAACMVLAKWVQPAPASEPITPIYLRPLIAGDALYFYISKLLVPIHLAVDYGRRPVEVIKHGWLYYTWLVPVAVAIIGIVLRRRVVMFSIGLLVFLVAVSPMLGWTAFDFQQYSTVADHYLYLPMLGIALALAALALNAIERLEIAVVMGTGGIIILVLGILAFRQTAFWQDDFTLFSHALQVNPQSGLAYNELVNAYVNRADIERQLASIQQNNGDVADARENRTHALADMKEALQFSRRAVELRPGRESWGSQGALLSELGDLPDSIEAYRKAMDYAPEDPSLIGSLGSVLAQAGQLQEAEKMLRRAIKVAPDYEKAHKDLGALKANEGDWAAAARELEIAVQLDPNDLQAQENLRAVLNTIQARH